MKLVIVGYGKVGKELVDVLVTEGNDITVIDTEEKRIADAVNNYDVLGVCGNGASIEILKEAKVDEADALIAVTQSDEINILSCLMAKKFRVKHLIARSRNSEYAKQIEWMKKEIGINVFINPEFEAANEIKNIISFPEAISIEKIGDGLVDLFELFIPANSPLAGHTLIELQNIYNLELLVCAVVRDEDIIIPRGNFSFIEGDHIFITAKRQEIKTLLKKLDLIESKIKNVLIIGGGRIGYYLIGQLLKNKINVKVIEQDKDVCIQLAEDYPDATVINGDGTKETLLMEEGLDATDCLVCLTGLDEENMIISMYANQLNVPKIITKVNKSNYKTLFDSFGFASVVSPKAVAISKIDKYIRSHENVRNNTVDNLYKFADNNLEAIEFIATNKDKVINKPLRELTIIDDCIVASIIKNNEVYVPNGSAIIEEGDRVIIVSKNIVLDTLDDILA